MSADLWLRWSYTEDGYPHLVDGSLASWLRAQDARRAARGHELESTAARVERLRAAGLAAAGALASTPAAPVSALLTLVVAASRLPGGLTASNDADGDGRPDHLYAPLPELAVQRVVTHGVLPRPAGLGLGLLPAVQRALTGMGADIVVYWLLQAEAVIPASPGVGLPRGALPGASDDQADARAAAALRGERPAYQVR